MRQDETLLELVRGHLTENHLSALSTAFEQNPSVIERMVEHLLPLIIDALSTRSRQPNGVEAVWVLSRQAHEAHALPQLSAPGPHKWQGRGVVLMQALMPGSYDGTIARLAAANDLTPAKVAQLLDLAVAGVLGTLGQYAAEQGLDADALSIWLQQQPAKQPVLAQVSARPMPQPAGLPPRPATMTSPPAAPPRPVAVASASASAPPRPASVPPAVPRPEPLPSLEIPKVAARSAATAAPPAAPLKFTVAGAGTWESVGGGVTFTPAKTETAAKRPRWQWALLLLPALGLGYGLGKRAESPRAPEPAQPAQVTAAPASVPASSRGAYEPWDEQLHTLTLADGRRLRVEANSAEFQLYRFLSDPDQAVDPVSTARQWINADQVFFEPGRATIRPASYQQLRNLAGILREFPAAHVKLGGYSDVTGTDEQNQRLSEARAKAAMLALTGLGVSRSRIEAQGMGPTYFAAAGSGGLRPALHRSLRLQVISKTGPPPAPAKSAALAVAAPAAAAGLTTRLPRASAPAPRPQRYGRERYGRLVGQSDKRYRKSKKGQWLKDLRKRLRSKRNNRN